ncbi:hypothetical protein CDAR_400201 [Caerostris darwini]|uniref:Maturase K n=1 Tax=Caerostris darwini TaxID=1538125 RepID=A0AAV4SEH2_9ARAC|nr:hypothetical protein CDAR_400201 [Caerostris darwini]
MSQDERLGTASDTNRISRVHWTMLLLMRWIPGPEISSAQDFQGSRSLLLLLLSSSSSKNISSHSLEPWQSIYLRFLKHVKRWKADFSLMFIFIIEELINQAEILI